jgi:hypothetical protein
VFYFKILKNKNFTSTSININIDSRFEVFDVLNNSYDPIKNKHNGIHHNRLLEKKFGFLENLSLYVYWRQNYLDILVDDLI